MTVLWVCNIPLPIISAHLGIKKQNICGWLTGLANSLTGDNDLKLIICFPLLGDKEVKHGFVSNIEYYSFFQPKLFGFLPYEDQIKCSSLTRKHLQTIISNSNPDILHVFGTEYPHSRMAVEVFNNPKKTIVSIQGLVSVCPRHFDEGLPRSLYHRFAFSNLFRGSICKQKKALIKRGKNEIRALELSGSIIGRTDWDYQCTRLINPGSKYYLCNETLRDSFYEGQWEFDNCEKYSIFMSQGSNPIKGLHHMVEALHILKKSFPEAKLYIAGNSLFGGGSLASKLKESSYSKYVKGLVKKYNLFESIAFTGQLDEASIKERYLRSNVFVSPSVIENSPNSLCEAMILGLPCVSSDVGGVSSLMKHNEEGYMYQSTAPYMLAFYIGKVFGNPEEAARMGKNAKKRASSTHDRMKNSDRLKEIYSDVYLNH